MTAAFRVKLDGGLLCDGLGGGRFLRVHFGFHLNLVGTGEFGGGFAQPLGDHAAGIAPGRNLHDLSALRDEEVAGHDFRVEDLPAIALGVHGIEHVELLLLHVGFDLRVWLAEDSKTRQALRLVGGVQFLKVRQFLVAAQAAAGEAHQHRAFGGKLGEVDFLAGGILDFEVGGGLADGDLLGFLRLGEGDGSGECEEQNEVFHR